MAASSRWRSSGVKTASWYVRATGLRPPLPKTLAAPIDVAERWRRGAGRRGLARPRKAAGAILQAQGAPEPPLRLALGDDAVDVTRATHERLRADLDAREHVSRATALD